MTLMRASRSVPRLLRAARSTGGLHVVPPAPMVAPRGCRCFYRGPGRDPFTQMEEFMRDVEKKFRRDIEGTMNFFMKDFPRLGPVSSAMVRPPQEPVFGQVEEASSPETFKLIFHFPNAKPEDIKVTLKGQQLSVKSQASVEGEGSRSHHEVSLEQTLPADVNLDGLESSLSAEGVLTVEAPRTPPASDQPKSIHIERD